MAHHHVVVLVPQPRGGADDAWAADRDVDWSTAVISLVRV